MAFIVKIVLKTKFYIDKQKNQIFNFHESNNQLIKTSYTLLN